MTYLSLLKLAIVIVVGSMWMGLGQVVSDLPFVVNLVIVEVIAIIGLDVARFVTDTIAGASKLRTYLVGTGFHRILDLKPAS